MSATSFVKYFVASFVEAFQHSLSVSCQGFLLLVGLSLPDIKLQQPMSRCDDETAVDFRPLEIIGDVMNAVSWLLSCSLLYIHGSVEYLQTFRCPPPYNFTYHRCCSTALRELMLWKGSYFLCLLLVLCSQSFFKACCLSLTGVLLPHCHWNKQRSTVFYRYGA